MDAGVVPCEHTASTHNLARDRARLSHATPEAPQTWLKLGQTYVYVFAVCATRQPPNKIAAVPAKLPLDIFDLEGARNEYASSPATHAHTCIHIIVKVRPGIRTSSSE